VSFDELKAVAERAAAFFTAESTMINELKGFNRELVVRSYSLLQRKVNDGPNSSQWEVDETLLRSVIEDVGRGKDPDTIVGPPDQDLPSKKDLSKRVKLVLSRTSASLALEKGKQGNETSQESPEQSHNFCVLDQSNSCNIFLAELLHAVLKVSITKVNGHTYFRRLLRYAYGEVDKKIATLEAKKSGEDKREGAGDAKGGEGEEDPSDKPEEVKGGDATLSKSSGDEKEDGPSSKSGDEKESIPQSKPVDEEGRSEEKEDRGAPGESADEKKDASSASSELSDMKKLKDNLRLVARALKYWNRQAKNVVRCILGMEPLKGSGNQPLFPPEKVEHNSPNPVPTKELSPAGPTQEQARDIKKSKLKQKESAAGDVAINRALAAGLQKGKKKLLMAKNDDGTPAPILKLTSIETLILSVICSQGLPVWMEDWEALVDPQCYVSSDSRKGEEFVINWYRMGGVVLNAATVWQDIASKNLRGKQRSLERNSANLTEDQVQELKHECKQLREDLDRKLAAIADARQLRSDPHQLARKSIMMLESLRRLMGPVESRSAGVTKKIKELSRQENGLGPRVVQWASKELDRWANSLNIVDENGTCISSTASDYMEGLPDANLAAFFDRKACRTIFIQVAQQTRLRSIFIKNGTNDVSSLMPKVLRNSRKNGDSWNKCPPWWSSREKDFPDATASKDDTELLVGLLDYGYSGFDEMLKQNSSFRARIENEKKAYEESADNGEMFRPVLTRSSAQLRANNLTRELNSLEDTAEVMRLVSERAKMRFTQDQAGTPEKNESASKKASSIQTGIDVFFKSSQGNEKKAKSSSKVSDTESVDSVEIIEVDGDESGISEKRKSSDDGVLVVESASKKVKAS